MTQRIPAKIAIVTGGSRGIGAATCTLLAQQGYDVCFSYHKDTQQADTVVEAISGCGQRALAVQADVADPDAVEHLFRECDEQLGTLTALVNNAGIVGDKARLDEIGLARFERILAVNVTGTFLCCKAAVQRMSTLHGGSGGSIVNVSSIAPRIGSPGEYVDYAASKGAVDVLTLGLAKEVATESIRVNAVRPGIIDTEIHASGGQPDRVARYAPSIPMQRGGRAEEVAESIVFLLSDKSTYTTGSLLDVGGGR